MDVMGSFVGVNCLQVLCVSHHVVLVYKAVSAHHVSGQSSNLERLAAVVPLYYGNHLGCEKALVLKLSYSMDSVEPKCAFRHHVGHLELLYLHAG